MYLQSDVILFVLVDYSLLLAQDKKEFFAQWSFLFKGRFTLCVESIIQQHSLLFKNVYLSYESSVLALKGQDNYTNTYKIDLRGSKFSPQQSSLKLNFIHVKIVFSVDPCPSAD